MVRGLLSVVLLLAGCRFDMEGIRRPEPEDLALDDAAADRPRADRPRGDRLRPPEKGLDQRAPDGPRVDRPRELAAPDTPPPVDLPVPDTQLPPDLPKPDAPPPKSCTDLYGSAPLFRLCKELPAQCQFFTNSYPGKHTCQKVCSDRGGSCLDGFDAAGYISATSQCTFSTQRGCADSYYFHICVCSRP